MKEDTSIFERLFKWLNRDVLEVRVIDTKVMPPKVVYQNHNITTAKEFVSICEKWNGKAQVYFSIQGRDGRGGKYENVPYIDFFPIDIDAVREKKHMRPADDKQRANAFRNAERILAYLQSEGVKPSLIVDTGNGVLILIRIPRMETAPYFYKSGDLTLNRLSDKMNRFYNKIRGLCDETVEVDSVGDLPRMLGVPCTLNMKGERPRIIVGSLEILENLPTPQEKMWSLIETYREEIIPSEPAKFDLTLENLLDMLPERLRQTYFDPTKAKDRSLVLVNTQRYLANKMKMSRDSCVAAMELLTKKIGRDRWPAAQQYDKDLAEGKIKGEVEKIETSFETLRDKHVIEMLYRPDEQEPEKQFLFAVWDGTSVEYMHSVKVNSLEYVPLVNDQLVLKNAVLLPSQAEEYGTDKELYEEIKAFIHKYVDQEEYEEKTDAYYVMLTWIYDDFPVVPYRRALGDWGTGKSRKCTVLAAICYKPTFLGGALRGPVMYRALERYRGTFYVDEADFKKSGLYLDIIKILNCGHEMGKPVLRCSEEPPFVIHAFRVYGPKILSTRERYDDEALESRCLTSEMWGLVRKDVPLLLPPEFWTEALHIRNKLLMWRFRNKGKHEIAVSDIDFTLEPRLNEIMLPLLSVIKDLEFRREIHDFIKEYGEQIRARRGLTDEAQILEAMYTLHRDGIPLTPGAIAGAINEKYGEYVVETKYGEEKRARKLIDSRTVGWRIKKKLHLKTERKKDGVHILWDPRRITFLLKRYGFEEEAKETIQKTLTEQGVKTFRLKDAMELARLILKERERV